MTLEAGKEMDRRHVINWLIEVYVTPSRAFDEYTEDELKMFAHDALVLLKEPEAVEPKTGYWIESKCLDECFWVCSECNFPSEAIAAPELYKYCPNCGTKMAERR